MRQTCVKICGITNTEDARAAAAFGADALGFIAVPDTPRYVTPDKAAGVMQSLPPFVTRVVVARDLRDATAYTSVADAVQYYRDDTDGATAAAHLPRRRVPVFRVRDEDTLREIDTFLTRARGQEALPDAVLLDTYHESALGGAGVSFDWALAVRAQEIMGTIPVILAGGLTPENVADAVRAVRPYAVDVSSGVEAAPGRKDHEKLRRFIAAVREADRVLR